MFIDHRWWSKKDAVLRRANIKEGRKEGRDSRERKQKVEGREGS